jgi:hypothetical protein
MRQDDGPIKYFFWFLVDANLKSFVGIFLGGIYPEIQSRWAFLEEGASIFLRVKILSD